MAAGRDLVCGSAAFVADVRLPGLLELAVVRSWEPHGRLKRVDLSRARACPGVVDAFAADALPASMGPIPIRLREPGLEAYLQPVLASHEVRYVGEPIAVLVADSRGLAEDALQAVEVELEPMSAVAEGEAGDVAARATVAVGDVEAELEGAAMVIERRFSIARQTAVPLETRGVLARWDEIASRLELWGPTKLPHLTRRLVEDALGLERGQVRVREVHAGGGFGVRGELYPEDLLIPLASLRTGRPVRWIEERREHLVTANHSREQEWRVRLGLGEDGRICGLDASFVNDMGAYLRTHGTVVPRLSATEMTGPYVVPAYRCTFAAAMTNKTPTGSCRSPGRYEATFVRERMLDLAAVELGIDPVEIRRRNLVRAKDMPYDTGLELDGIRIAYDSGDYTEALELAAARGLEAHDLVRGVSPGHRLGFGIALYSEATGHGPTEAAALTLRPDGSLEVETGAPSLGQGHETVFARVAAAAVGLPLDRVAVVPLDTDSLGRGGGTWASRGATVAGPAVLQAATALRERLVELAAEHLGCPVDRVEVGRGGVRASGEGPGLSWRELTELVGQPEGFRVEAAFRPRGTPFSYGATAATVSVDPDTGQVVVRSLLIVADVGRVLDLEIVRGQLTGAAVQGIGGALLEELPYTPAGQPLGTSFLDYLLPTVCETPRVEVVVLEGHPSPLNPLGAKGAGELGILGSAPAIANAVADALAGSGVDPNAIPLGPERVLGLLASAPDGVRRAGR